MLRRARLLLFPIVTLAAACGAPAPRSASSDASRARPLPLRTLRLYETGVGYFERSGKAGDEALRSLPVPAGHLDDALKSLVVLNGGGGGQITGVAYASSVTRATARARAGLQADGSQPIAFKDLLVSMKGEKVTVALRGARDLARGRVVEVTEETADPAKPDVKRLVVTLLTDRGEVMTVDAQEISKIRPVDEAFARRLDDAVDALSPRSAQNQRPLTLLGDARGEVTFGYIAETPIWRTSYRLVVGGSGAQLQGWALIHNDTDERWQGVHLELVNGEPDSFLFPVAAPRYARRELIHPETPFSTLPQLQGTTADTLWGDNVDTETIGVGSASGFGYGSGSGRVSGSHTTKAPSIRMGTTTDVSGSSLLSVGNLAALAPAQGVENGALFVYAIPAAFELDGHTSALVPFLSKGVGTESIAYFSAPGEAARAAVRFVNDTGQTLPAGTLAVFASGGFAGETALDRLKPGERRFLQFGADLDAEVEAKGGDRKEEAKRLTFDGDRLQEHFLATTTNTWELENRGAGKRTFYVGLAADRNASVTGTDRVDFDETASRPVVVFDAPPRSKAPRTFTVVEGLSRSFPLDGITAKVVRDLLQKTTVPAAELAILAQAEPAVRALEGELVKAREAERVGTQVQQDLDRFREHLKALGEKSGGPGVAASALVKRVLDLEDKLEASRKVRASSDEELGKRREAVRAALAKLRRR